MNVDFFKYKNREYVREESEIGIYWREMRDDKIIYLHNYTEIEKMYKRYKKLKRLLKI